MTHPVAPDVHEVRSPEGSSLAHVTRRAPRFLPWPRRTRWSVRFAGSSREATGRVGTWYAWLLYVVTAPVWFLFALCVTVYPFFDGTAEDGGFRSPTRTRWRLPGAGTVLDHRGAGKAYRHLSASLDTRVAYALAVLRTWERGR
ncbi:hypothetical protein ACWCPT_11835 [Streptomyces sp. NPDC002308]